ncbi:MarR family transcriptional regulator [Burkholderia sp. AU30280]|uniref:MarR family winged helix-turn-helix transcriptional regulator n=1 Tax=Burkholderia sp. AU30280 TaxID=2879628 RepID=UPI001CF1822E|nr:MarR family transcriptional regulator [Burkholderia sp. AU30280]MCA8277842.1 MarR family transcriptional regulator [Burkholderia sp. AU30280]
MWPPATAGQTGSETERAGFVLVKARNLITSEMDAALRDLDITAQQMGVLLSLRAGSSATPFELSKLLGVDTGLMTRVLDKLECMGLVERSRSVSDRRVVSLAPTEAGRAVAVRIPEIKPKVLNARLRKFSKAEFDELSRLLHTFIGE